MVIVLASVPRRVARTIASDVPGITFVIAAREESNAPTPERIGRHLPAHRGESRTVGRHRRCSLPWGRRGVDHDHRAKRRPRRHARISTRGSWNCAVALQRGIAIPTVDRAAVAQQRSRLTQIEADRAAMNGSPRPPTGSYFDARVVEIAPELPKRPDVEHTIASYFRLVNDHNHDAYVNLHSPPAQPGQAAYVGMEQCRDCHAEAFDIWERTPHSHAYHTLEVVSKNFNLSCVGCHVTGYRQAGGAEVVQNDGLRDVQCESCHGPGSLHVAARTDAQRRATIRRDVPGTFCATQCHTQEHSDRFDYATYLPRILGPGHGYPVREALQAGSRYVHRFSWAERRRHRDRAARTLGGIR